MSKCEYCKAGWESRSYEGDCEYHTAPNKDETTTQESLLQTLSILETENERLHDVFDKIADELEEMRPTVRHTDEYWQGVSYGICYVLDNAIKIIDKYRAESKGVLEQLAEEQNSLTATCKAWSEAIDKAGYVN